MHYSNTAKVLPALQSSELLRILKAKKCLVGIDAVLQFLRKYHPILIHEISLPLYLPNEQRPPLRRAVVRSDFRLYKRT